MSRNVVGWFEIYVQDMPRAKAFYEAVFQKTLNPLPVEGMEMCEFPHTLEGYGAGGALVKMQGVPSCPGGSLVYFHCEDCGVEAQRIVEHGGQIFKAKMACGDYGFMVLAYDCEGNMIGLHSMQ
jgi:hypothetical protein